MAQPILRRDHLRRSCLPAQIPFRCSEIAGCANCLNVEIECPSDHESVYTPNRCEQRCRMQGDDEPKTQTRYGRTCNDREPLKRSVHIFLIERGSQQSPCQQEILLVPVQLRPLAKVDANL